MARCRRNVDNFLEACRKIGISEVSKLISYYYLFIILNKYILIIFFIESDLLCSRHFRR